MSIQLVASRTFWEVVASSEEFREPRQVPARSRALSDGCLDANSLAEETCAGSDISTIGSSSDAEDTDSEVSSDHSSSTISMLRWSEAEDAPIPMPPGVWAPKMKVVSSRKGTQRLIEAPKESAAAKPAQPLPMKCTTMVLRDVPLNWNRADLLELLRSEGLLDSCDFLYLPTNFKRSRTFGYGVVNLTSTEAANQLMEQVSPGPHGIRGEWSTAMQGVKALLDRYRNSPVMHPLVPDEHRPLLLQNGNALVFPAPTQPLKLPEAFERHPAGSKLFGRGQRNMHFKQAEAQHSM